MAKSNGVWGAIGGGGKRKTFQSALIASYLSDIDEHRVENEPPYYSGGEPRLQTLFRNRCRQRGFSHRTVKTYWHWIRQYLKYFNFKHPRALNERDVEAFLSHLAQHRQVSKATQNIAFNALRFLYLEVLLLPFDNVQAIRVKREARVPEVFTHEEALRVISHLVGPYQVMGQLMYGSGLRLSEVYRLRIKDVDIQAGQIVIRAGKGEVDRITLLPQSVIPALTKHLTKIQALHDSDIAQGFGKVSMPNALARKYPSEQKSLHWQFVFPASRLAREPISGEWVRHHIHETSIQKSVRKAIRSARIGKRSSSHTFRHSFATRLIQRSVDITTVQKLLGHKDVRTTQIYLHTAGGITNIVKSPLD